MSSTSDIDFLRGGGQLDEPHERSPQDREMPGHRSPARSAQQSAGERAAIVLQHATTAGPSEPDLQAITTEAATS
jgi:hypothetical protein